MITYPRSSEPLSTMNSSTAGPDGIVAGTGAPYWRQRAWWQRAAWTSATFWTAHAVTLLGSVVAARGLGAESYGAVVLALATCSTVALFSDITLDEALVFFGIKDAQERQGAHLRPLFRMALGVDLTLGVGVFAGLALAASPLASLAGGSLDPHLVRLAALSVLAATANGTTRAVFLVAGRADLWARASLVTSLIRLGLLVLVARRGQPSDTLVALALATAVGAVAQGGLAWWRIWRRWPPSRAGSRSGVGVRPLLRFAAHSSITSSLSAATTSVVPLILGRTLGTTAVAQFNVAATPLIAAGVLTAPLRSATLPEQTALWARGDHADVRRNFSVVSGGVMAASAAVLLLGWWVLPKTVLFVYGESFRGAIPTVQILLFALPGLMVSSWAKLSSVAIGKPSARTKVGVVDCLTTIALVGILSASNGLPGAAAGYAAATAITALLWVVLLRHELRGNPGTSAPGGPARLKDSPHGPHDQPTSHDGQIEA